MRIVNKKILTAFMATTVSAAIVLPASNASAALNDLSINPSYENVAATEAVSSGEVSLTISSVTGDTIRTSKGNFTASTSLKTIFNSTNRQALQNAKATVIVNDGEIIKITALTINSSGTTKKALVFDGGNAKIAGDLTASANYLKIQNVTVEGDVIVTTRVKKSLKFDSVTMQGALTIKPLNIKNISWLNIYFTNTPVSKTNVERTKIMLISDKLLSTIQVSKKASAFEVEANVEKLVIDVQNDLNLYGTGKIEQVVVNGGNAISLTSAHTINNVQINDQNAKVTLPQVSKTELNNLISSIKYVAVSSTGNDVYTTDKWTTQAEKTAFETAVSKAQTVARDAKAPQTQVNEAYKTLNSAIANYQAVQKYGKKYTNGDKYTLTSLINSIQYATVSWNNGNDVASYVAWTTQAERNAIDAAVSSAQNVVNNAYATYDQISSAINQLNNAITIYKNAHKYGYYGYGADKSILSSNINSIQYVSVSTNGYDIPPYTAWTTQAERNAIDAAVASAQNVVNNIYATSDQVTTAIYNLNNAIAIYNNAKRYGYYDGYTVDKSALTAKINSVQYVDISSNGYDIPPYLQWTTYDAYSSMITAVQSAQNVVNDFYATQEQINSALNQLNNAINSYNLQKSYGLRSY